MIRTWFSPARCGLLLLLFTALSLIAYVHAVTSFTGQLQTYIEQSVLKKTDKAELYSFNDATTQSYLVQEISRNLASLCPSGFNHILRDCSAQVVSFKGLGYANPAGARFTLDFYQEPESPHPLLQVAVFYRVHWGYLLGTQGLLALLTWLALGLIPKPISNAQLTWIQALKRWGLDDKQAIKLIQPFNGYPTAGAARLGDLWVLGQQAGIDLSPALALTLASNPRVINLTTMQLPWLLKGLEQYPQQLDKALAIAESRDQLIFDPVSKSVSIHGLGLPLADTPFFYFYWYALLRLSSGEGWYTNPAQTRPDVVNSHALRALFEKYGGHAKAASELQEKGLRAKTLDQNRSKIKDELVRQLGEELALPYLFDDQRDTRTARFKYRISLAPDYILVVPEDLQLVQPLVDSPSAIALAI